LLEKLIELLKFYYLFLQNTNIVTTCMSTGWSKIINVDEQYLAKQVNASLLWLLQVFSPLQSVKTGLIIKKRKLFLLKNIKKKKKKRIKLHKILHIYKNKKYLIFNIISKIYIYIIIYIFFLSGKIRKTLPLCNYFYF